MSITGTTQTCTILDNTQFYLSGLSQTNISSIIITDSNGMDVSDCFGISSRIVKVKGDNITTTGDCETSLEVIVTEGLYNPVECLYTGYTEQNDGLIIVTYGDGSTSLNVHPECCTSLGFTPELGVGKYYVCRWSEPYDPLDCNNYITTTFDVNDYMIFEVASGGTTTIVPSVECCYDNNLVEFNTTEGVRCIQYVEPDVCSGLTVIEPAPNSGDIPFLNTNGVSVTLVPTLECCTSNGFNYRIEGSGFVCYKSLVVVKPTVSISNEACCQNTTVVTPITNSGVFSNGISVNHSHSLPAADPDFSTITGTLTVTGNKTYTVNIKNQYNYGNYGTGLLTIVRNGGTAVGTLSVSTDGTSSTKVSSGTLALTAGTYTYTLKATLDITGTSIGGAVTASIVTIV